MHGKSGSKLPHSKFLVVLLLLLAAAFAPHVHAQTNYPTRPIRMLVPNAPGSSVDTLSRIIGNKMNEVVGQQIVVDNRAGAGGIVGMEIAKHAAPDGYTLISATTAASTVAVLLMKSPTFDPVKDYDHLSQFAVTANVLVVHPSVAAKSVRELIDQTKEIGRAHV